MPASSVFVVSAPSGAGKSTLIKRLMAEVDGLTFSVSHTTRGPRPGEVDGVHYHFVHREEFERLIEAGMFVEWAEVHGNLYGTSFKAVRDELDKGNKVILDIDVQGAKQLKGKLDAEFIFVLPPSWEELKARLVGRADVAPEVMDERLSNARREIQEADGYDHLVVNDDLERAYVALKSIVVDGRSDGEEANRTLEGLMDALRRVK